MAKFHGNSHKNEQDHHLYEIYDNEEKTTYKYGISGQPLNTDGSSPRANEQINIFNRLFGWIRFIANILITNIEGREKARQAEEEHISDYENKNGKRPKGNV